MSSMRGRGNWGPGLLDIEDSVGRVGGGLVLGGVTDEALLIGESDVGRSDTVTLIVDENFNLALLHHTDTGVGSAQILERGFGLA